MEIRQLKISDIQPNDGQIEGLPTNPRFIKDDKFRKLVESLQSLPSLTDARPVIVYPLDGKFIAIGGNMRVRAAKELKWKTINCAILEKETTADVLREIAIKDNVGYGENDWELLSNDWDAAELEAWGMDLPSFGNEEENDLDYSDKNKEIDTDDFSDKMVLKLEYSSEEFLKVKQALSNAGVTPEAALYKYLFPNEQLPF